MRNIDSWLNALKCGWDAEPRLPSAAFYYLTPEARYEIVKVLLAPLAESVNQADSPHSSPR